MGVKPTVMVEDAPGARDMGVLIPDIEKEFPTVALEMVRVPEPVFFTVTVWVSEVPTETLLKLTLEGVTEI